MYQIQAQEFERMMNILKNIVDVDDIIVKNKKVSINTNSNHVIIVDLGQLDIPDSAEFELTQFNQIFETLKVLTDFKSDIEYGINDEEVIFLFPQGKFQYVRGIIQNKWIENPEEDNGDKLFELLLTKENFTKISKLITFYKADPVLTTNEKNQMIISIKPRTSDRSIDILLHESDLFSESNIQTENGLSLTLSPSLFQYSTDGDVLLTFYKDEQGYKVSATFTLLESPVTYIFVTDENIEFDFSSVDDLSNLLDMN